MENEKDKDRERTLRVLEAARTAWDGMSEFRAKRRRYMRYTYGDQWGDPSDSRGKMTEGEAMRKSGGRPLTNNLIRRMVKAVVGRYRRLCADSAVGQEGGDSGDAAEHWRRFNSADELDARMFEEFLISGAAIQRVGFDVRQGRKGLWIDNVNPDMYFASPISDLRGCDTELAGRLIDMSIDEVCRRFGRGDARRVRALKHLYAALAGGYAGTGLPGVGDRSRSFFQAAPGRCRVIEVWTLESTEYLRVHDPLDATMRLCDTAAENRLERCNRHRRRRRQPLLTWRWEPASGWRCRYIAPDGTLLGESHSADGDAGHPFAVRFYPLVDGAAHSLVEDVLDQQRCVNRLVSTMDRMMSTAAKGVLLFPVRSKIEGMDWDDVVRMWSDPGGVIPYRPDDSGEPHQVVTPVSDMGAVQMLQTHIDMFQDVGGVSSTLMGKNINPNIGAERYKHEVENSSVAVEDLMRTFAHFIMMRNELIDRALNVAPTAGQR